jgi:phosphoribosylformimino-5-aminoimidazole carboxamide ribotide isomerase
MCSFTVYPAIDLHNGQVVRLAQGDLNRQTVYHTDPAAAAQRWLRAGARWLHVVNLDGAFEHPDQANRQALAAILSTVSEAATGCRVQFGGGLRSMDAARQALDAGVNRIVLGTAAVQSPSLVEQILAQYGPEKAAVGLDARAGKVMLRGWTEDSALDATGLAQQFAKIGLRTLIFTDIARDGVGTGVNITASQALSQSSGLEVIASGGVRSLADVRQVQRASLAGVIIGRALFEGSFALEEALQLERD